MHLGHAYFVLVAMGSRESEIELLFQLASHQVPPVERFERQTNVSNGSLFIYFIPFIHVRGQCSIHLFHSFYTCGGCWLALNEHTVI
jgi:hypothetical protein